MTNAKQIVQDVLRQLPDDCTIEDVHYQLYVVETLRQRAEMADRGDFASQEEVQKRMQRWLMR